MPRLGHVYAGRSQEPNLLIELSLRIRVLAGRLRREKYHATVRYELILGGVLSERHHKESAGYLVSNRQGKWRCGIYERETRFPSSFLVDHVGEVTIIAGTRRVAVPIIPHWV